MKRITFIISILLSAVICVNAQYKKKNDNYPQTEISVSIGIASVPIISNSLGGHFSSPIDCEYEPEMATGAIGLQYLHYVRRKAGLGFVAAYESINCKDEDHEGVELKNNFISFMPTAKGYWFRGRIIGMYSRIAGGVYLNLYEKHDDLFADMKQSKKKAGFAWQASPISIEVGTKNFSAFVEAGFGYQGVAVAGIKVAF